MKAELRLESLKGRLPLPPPGRLIKENSVRLVNQQEHDDYEHYKIKWSKDNMGSCRSYGADKDAHERWLFKQADWIMYKELHAKLVTFRDDDLSGKKVDFDRANKLIDVFEDVLDDMEHAF